MIGQIIINGLMLAGNYGLVAVGLTLVFGVMRMINFASGQSVMIGAFVALSASHYVGYVPAILVAMLVNAGLGVLLERGAFRPFRATPLNGLIASMGVSIILINAAELIWGSEPQPFDTALSQMTVTLGTVGVSGQRILVIVTSLGLLLALWWLIHFSSLGRQFRAVSEDPEIASAMGINTNRVAQISVVLGSALAGAAGALSGPVNLVSTDLGQPEMLSAFAAIVLGGFGNVNGTILGAIVIGMVQSVASVYVSNAYSQSIAFGLLIVTLIFFPRGLVAERLEENV